MICHKLFRAITNTHLNAKHKIDRDTYVDIYPNAKVCSRETSEIISKMNSGAGNGMFGVRLFGETNGNYGNHPVSPRKGLTRETYFGKAKARRIRAKQSHSQKKNFEDPSSGYNSELWRMRLSKANIGKKKCLGKHWKLSKKTKEKHRIATKRNRADPNSKYNSPEYLEKVASRGRKCYAPDGHFCQSDWELQFELWLIENNIDHIPHPRISNSNGCRADQLVGTCFIELNGWGRTIEEFAEKYACTNIDPLIINFDDFSRTESYLEFFDRKLGFLKDKVHV